MHELGIVFYIIKEVKKAAEENKAKQIHSVTLDLGEVSTVIPEYLIDAWKWAAKREGPILENAELKIDKIDAITYCEGCQKTYPTVEYGKICPHCGSEKTYLLKGNEVSIKQIEAI